MARLKASEKYAKNPFAQQAIIHTVTGTRMIYRILRATVTGSRQSTRIRVRMPEICNLVVG